VRHQTGADFSQTDSSNSLCRPAAGQPSSWLLSFDWDQRLNDPAKERLANYYKFIKLRA